MCCLTVPKVDEAGKCVVCGGDMFPAGYTVIETGEKLYIDPSEPNKFLSGCTKNYICLNWHEATSEEPESKGKVDSFEDAETLVGYMEIHAKTPRALVTFKHLVYLGYIASWDIAHVTKKSLENRWMLSLHTHPHIVTHARERLSKGLVPKNWFEMFNKQIDEQS